MKRLFFYIVNSYVQHFTFPKHGWKYFRWFLKKTGIEKERFIVKLQDGLRMYVTPADHIQQYIFWERYYEKPAVMVLKKIIQPDSVFFDIGANSGYYSLIAANKAIHGKVYSFEPATRHFQKLLDNIHLNKLSNIKVFNTGIGNKNEKAIFYLSSDENSGMSGLRPAENFSGKTALIEVVRLDDFSETASISSVDIIKIDIEGAELNALEGMEKIILKYKPVFFIEMIGNQLHLYNKTIADVFEWLTARGYSAFDIEKNCTLTKLTSAKEGYTILFVPEGYSFPDEIKIN
ncbi:MAG: FkbM family methyltransferase [Sphingobacteriales bacterium]|nr:FkbM family methyltransferase [Sphingobacteriales bacterium]